MKLRSGFVSNSSSSSFIVIGQVTNGIEVNRLRDAYGNKDQLVITTYLGCHEFGWEHTTYTEFWSKVFFAFCQADYMKEIHPGWMAMLELIIKDKLKVKEIVWEATTDYKYGDIRHCYIDHQSAATEGQNTEMFDSEQNLINFLFSTNSYIQGGNDNE